MNARAQNKQPSQKARDEYQHATAFPRTQAMGHAIENSEWSRADIERTSHELVEFAIRRWG
jgi:hypothetical protein